MPPSLRPRTAQEETGDGIVLFQDLRRFGTVTVGEGDDKRTLPPEEPGANEWPWHRNPGLIEYTRKDGRKATVKLTSQRKSLCLYVVVSAQ